MSTRTNDEEPTTIVRILGDLSLRRFAVAVVIVAVAALVVLRVDGVLSLVGVVWDAVSPFALGACLAYVINLVMVRWERVVLPSAAPGTTAARARRPICLVLALLSIAAVVALVVVLVSGEVKDAALSLWHGIADVLQVSGVSTADAPAKLAGMPPDQLVDTVAARIDSAITEAGGFLQVAGRLMHVGARVAGGALNVVVAIVFALYLLAGKERVLGAVARAGRLVLPERAYAVSAHVLKTADACFSGFIFGQCLEGIVLGSLCAIGMAILRLPYAATVGLVIGLGALVPIVGAWVAGLVGALMILPVSPMAALTFVIYLLVLQQIDNHFVYPHVVGLTTGVSSILVLVAVFVGGALFGILGVLLGVPIMATGRVLALEWAERREGSKGASDEVPAS